MFLYSDRGVLWRVEEVWFIRTEVGAGLVSSLVWLKMRFVLVFVASILPYACLVRGGGGQGRRILAYGRYYRLTNESRMVVVCPSAHGVICISPAVALSAGLSLTLTVALSAQPGILR